MAKRKVRKLVTYEVDNADFPQLKGALAQGESAELSEEDYKRLKAFAGNGILDVAVSDSYSYGRNGSVYVACACADTSGGRRKRAKDSVERILARCHHLEQRADAKSARFDLEASNLVDLARLSRLKEMKNFRFEMKCVTPNMGGGELRTISAEDREKAEQLYWAWSSFKNQPNEDGTYNGYCGKYRLSVTEA